MNRRTVLARLGAALAALVLPWRKAEAEPVARWGPTINLAPGTYTQADFERFWRDYEALEATRPDRAPRPRIINLRPSDAS